MEMQSFKPSHEMTFATVPLDCERLIHYCAHNESSFINLDLSDVIHCDSAGLALLIEAKRLAREKNKACHIVGMSNIIYALAEFYGVETILEPVEHK